MKIPYTTAVLGGEIKIHTLYGDVVCKIKPGTQSGAKIRLKGKGVAAMNNPAVHGDEYYRNMHGHVAECEVTVRRVTCEQ